MNVSSSQSNSGLENLVQEQFCLSYELRSLTDLLVRKKTERWVPGFADRLVEIEHVARYQWASQFVSGRRVLDLACGAGKGSFILASEGNAREVIGCDRDADTIRYASHRYAHPAASFQVTGAHDFFEDGRFDVITCFETIEHLSDVGLFLENMRSLLDDRGFFIVSTPIAERGSSGKPSNPFHEQEWGFFEFQEIISQIFQVQEVFVQLRPDPKPPRFPRIHKATGFLKCIFGVNDSRHGGILEPDSIMRPVTWNAQQIPAEMMGNTLAGYQIIMATGKGSGKDRI